MVCEWPTLAKQFLTRDGFSSGSIWPCLETIEESLGGVAPGHWWVEAGML